ncbi:GFA family protein [Shinella sp. JR1-6]|uniref:GFA family protein n=1 Tax=Shinella sp. JR1-6 TaxID=2527671 RepID=UPI00102D3A60|nr:GFA family protein [Shinella sp. JR1-6]TAA63905.1 GFA family protein [Shinella sp. JR1-6]
MAQGENPLDKDIETIGGACHCGSVRFRVRLANGLHSARRCSCSYCRMRGAIAVSANLSDIAIEEGEELLTLYQFNTKTAKHYFCARCGIYTHHQRRSNPEQYGVNVACLEGISPFDFSEIPVNDGVSHPSDRPAGTGPSLAGVLRFIPADESALRDRQKIT